MMSTMALGGLSIQMGIITLVTGLTGSVVAMVSWSTNRAKSMKDSGSIVSIWEPD